MYMYIYHVQFVMTFSHHNIIIQVQKKQQFAYIQSHTPSTFKVPLDNKSQYRPDNSHVMVPVHIKVGGEKTVEGVLSVVT